MSALCRALLSGSDYCILLFMYVLCFHLTCVNNINDDDDDDDDVKVKGSFHDLWSSALYNLVNWHVCSYHCSTQDICLMMMTTAAAAATTMTMNRDHYYG